MVSKPLSYKEAKDKEEWRNTMKEEIDANKRNEPWEFLDLLISCDVMGVKWIYSLKFEV